MDTENRKAIKSAIFQSGKRTFFFDIFLATNNKRYLRITESRMPEQEGGERKRNSFVLFPEDIESFQAKMGEIIGSLSQ